MSGSGRGTLDTVQSLALGTALVLGASLMAQPAHADSEDALRAEIDALRHRVEELESREARTPRREEPLSAPPASSSREVELEVYGFLTSESAWETFATGDRFLNIVPENGGDSGDEDFLMSANATRVGLRVSSGPDASGGLSLGGVLEVDFDTDDGGLRIRHAYAELLHPSAELLFGQTWAVIGQLNPDTINSDNLFNLGNVYERVPLARVARDFEVGGGRLRLEAAALRFFGAFDQGDADGTPLAIQQPGATTFRIVSTGLPTGQARVAWWPGGGDAYGALAISGGVVRVEDDATGTERVGSWLATAELMLPAWGDVRLSGEGFWGRAGGFNTGVGQTVMIDASGARACAIESRGGFGQLAYAPTRVVRMNLIYGIDNPENSACGRTVAIQRNQTGMANLFWRVHPSVDLAFEIQHVRTEWNTGFDADDLRFTQAVYLNF